MGIKVEVVNEGKEVLPAYSHPGDAGVDLRAVLKAPLTLWPGQTLAVPTGLRVKLPEAITNGDWVWVLQIVPRSGLALHNGITVNNSPGTIDSTYTGEIKVILHNNSDQTFEICSGDRIAQALLTIAYKIEWIEVDELTATERDAAGFGSSGIK